MRRPFGAALLLAALAAHQPVAARTTIADEVAAPAPRPDINDELAYGRQLSNIRHFDQAIEIFGGILTRVPGFAPALAERALALAFTNRLVEAESDLALAARDMPDAAVIHLARAVIADRRSDDPAAIVEYSRALEIDPGNRLALRFRAYQYDRAGDEAAALADAETHIAAWPDDPDGYVLEADLLVGQRRRAEAAAVAARLADQFPDDSYALAAAARVYERLADRDRAMAMIDAAIAQEPGDSRYYLVRASIRHWSDVAGRRADLVAALRLDPDDFDALAELGLVDFEERKWDDAIARFSRILESEPNDFGVLAYRAMARLNLGDRAAAERDFQAGLAASSGPDDFNLMAGAVAKTGFALDWGLDACNRAIARDDTKSDYHANRALIELRLGRIEAARADFDAAITADPSLPRGYYGRAIVRLRSGDVAGAMTDRAEALAIDPGIAEYFQQAEFGALEQSAGHAAAAGRAR